MASQQCIIQIIFHWIPSVKWWKTPILVLFIFASSSFDLFVHSWSLLNRATDAPMSNFQTRDERFQHSKRTLATAMLRKSMSPSALQQPESNSTLISYPSKGKTSNREDTSNTFDLDDSENLKVTPISFSENATLETSLGSFLLQRQKIEEEQLRRWKNRPNSEGSVPQAMGDEKNKTKRRKISHIQILDETATRSVQASAIKSKSTQGKSDQSKTMKTPDVTESRFGEMDKEQAKELDEAVSVLPLAREAIMKDITILANNVSSFRASPTISLQTDLGNQPQLSSDEYIKKVKTQKRKWWAPFSLVANKITKDDTTHSVMDLPLSRPQHTDRIEMDMRHLAVSISSSIDTAGQWKMFCEDGGSILPLLHCIFDGALVIEQSTDDEYFYGDSSTILMAEQREVIISAASSACKTLRDLSAISKALNAVITDEILRYDAAWSSSIPYNSDECKAGGIISSMLTLLRYSSSEVEAVTNRRIRRRGRQIDYRLQVTEERRIGTRRQRKEARKRCGLYVLQLFLSMAFASDDAINSFRATSGLVDTVLAFSSFAQKERFLRRWIRYPVEVLKRRLIPSNKNRFYARNPRNAFLAAASVAGGLTGQIQAVSNQILAAIGYNVWLPKIPGQKGIRILSLDGGGTRGITAISTLRAIVGAMGGIEVCDSFDMIVGTSTGAIIAFLVGLRRESSQMAKKRYDRLIRRIFVKSAWSAPMLVFTTATYDETPFNSIMEEILLDNSMLASRADPTVPLVFAVSSKLSSSPTQLCLFRNYNYSGGEKRDPFVINPEEARQELGLPPFSQLPMTPFLTRQDFKPGFCSPRSNEASRHPGSFRVLQRVALRASTAAPTVFKPVKMAGELYCDGGIVASNPTAVAIHEARNLFPNVPIEMVVSCGTGAFVEEKSAPRIGWDGIISQIIMSATDCEKTHHVLEDILGQGGTAQLGRSSVSKTIYYRFNPVIGTSDMYPIDNTDPVKLEELNEITTKYMKEPEQARKLREISEILDGRPWWKKLFVI